MSYLQVPGESPAIFLSIPLGVPLAKELSIFVDESGDRGGKARYYLLTLVFHDQADSIAEAVTGYEAKLARADLPNIPFHSEPLMNGHKDYEFLGIEQRKRNASNGVAGASYATVSLWSSPIVPAW
ncbi:hypothetical protein [Collinsella bouchesdurhonensis]|uniref:hypothetical protein n=1 Tax=Collinsella bouchesdurhonensis TaxID=1907654 RepID=UPI0006936BC5|nr:hypothetical protein [Collinsella bouchesdurhonensis]